MQRYASNSATKITAPPAPGSGSSGTCATGGVHNVLTYILIFFLVLLVCYAVVYLFRIYNPQPAHNPTPTKEKFDQAGATTKRHAVVALFWENCGHCKRFRPIFDKVADEYKMKPQFNRDWTIRAIYDTEVAKKTYNVTSFPTVVVLKNDQVVETKVGGMDEHAFRDFIDRHVGKHINIVQEEH